MWNPNTIVRSGPEKSGSHIVLLLVFSVMVCAANTFSSHFSRKVKQRMVSVCTCEKAVYIISSAIKAINIKMLINKMRKSSGAINGAQIVQ